MADDTTDPDRESMLREAERGLMKTRHRLRMLRLELADVYRTIAQLRAANLRSARQYRGEIIRLIFQAIDLYQLAGFSRQAQAVERWMGWLRRAWRRAGGEE